MAGQAEQTSRGVRYPSRLLGLSPLTIRTLVDQTPAAAGQRISKVGRLRAELLAHALRSMLQRHRSIGLAFPR